MILNDQSQKAEELTAALLLSVAGGFLDVYSYLYRGHVFANAVTGNIVLLGLNLSGGEWSSCGKYLLAIAAYASGVLAACLIHDRLPGNVRNYWHQAVLLCEIALITAVSFVPYGTLDFVANTAISFLCAMQVQTFRRVRGLPFASTMCTGNLRSGSEALFHGLREHESSELRKALHYYAVIAVFLLGAFVGAIALGGLGTHTILVVPALLLVVALLITSKRQRVWLLRLFRKHRRRKISH